MAQTDQEKERILAQNMLFVPKWDNFWAQIS